MAGMYHEEHLPHHEGLIAGIPKSKLAQAIKAQLAEDDLTCCGGKHMEGGGPDVADVVRSVLVAIRKVSEK
jgi:hypothetical protein